MTAAAVVPVLLAGGSGTRLWPLSREQYPKQFLPLLGESSLLVQTLQRVRRLSGLQPPLVVAAEAHRFIVAEQLRQAGVSGATILLEPVARNTAAAIAAASHWVQQQHGAQARLLVLPADQAIADSEAFVAAAGEALLQAAAGHIALFGIRPTRAETGFGYIRTGAARGAALAVEAFVEKPARERAERYLAEGGYWWNGGMFVFSAGRMLDELGRLEPELCHHSGEAVAAASPDVDFLRLAAAPFAACRAVSIDVAVMERSPHAVLIPLDAGWDDVGSWRYLASLPAGDAAGNRWQGDVLLEAARDNLVHASSRLVTLLGVSDQVVVETADAVLVAARDQVQDVRRLVERLRGQGRTEALQHPRVHRPWGWYETLALAERYQVKRLQVHPGQRLSLQMHHHRAEHWTVVRGTAEVTCGERVFMLTEDQSTYIPVGTPHRLHNPGKLPLDLIEVQSGAYLGEDDIVRFEDVYGRSGGS
ncbi:MAG TPA: mannose-1-phosphate guanylyltransferase/mannose-6-phosphate isomerase [Nevskiaceae bacterium]|nr:mannose-1-phosphate guanylyltransferase/mannose-6-phosphate isomerase [Nevskiaceae bacterium]